MSPYLLRTLRHHMNNVNRRSNSSGFQTRMQRREWSRRDYRWIAGSMSPFSVVKDAVMAEHSAKLDVIRASFNSFKF